MGLFNWGKSTPNTDIDVDNVKALSLDDVELSNTSSPDYIKNVKSKLSHLLYKNNLNSFKFLDNLQKIENLDDVRYASVQKANHLSDNDIDIAYRHLIFDFHKLIEIETSIHTLLRDTKLHTILTNVLVIIIKVPASYPEFQNELKKLINILNELNMLANRLQINQNIVYEFDMHTILKYASDKTTTQKIRNNLSELETILNELQQIYDTEMESMFHYTKDELGDTNDE